MPDQMIRKVFLGEIKQVASKEPVITAKVSTNELDRYKEICKPEAFKKRLGRYKSNPVVLWSHSHAVYPIAKTEKIRIVENGIEAKMRFAVAENPDAKIVYDLMRNGYLNAFSIGFLAHAWDEPEDKEISRIFTDCELLEISICNVAAASEALVMERSLDEAVEKGIIPKERADEFRPDVDIDEVLKTLKRESLLPEEDDSFVRVPLLRASQYDVATARAFLYSKEDDIQCVTAQKAGGGIVPVRFVFGKSKRWDPGKAQKWVDKIEDEDFQRIGENLHLTQDMDLMAGRDLFEAIEHKAAVDRLKQVKVEEPEPEPEIEVGAEDLGEELKEEKERIEPDPMKPYEDKGHIYIPMTHPDDLDEHSGMVRFTYDANGTECVMATGEGGNPAIKEFIFSKAHEHRWTVEHAVEEIGKMDAQEILGNLDVLGRAGRTNFKDGLKAKRAEEEAAKLEIEKEEGAKVDAEELQGELEEAKKEAVPDPMAPHEDDEYVHLPLTHPNELDEKAESKKFKYDNSGIECVITIDKDENIVFKEFIFSKSYEHRWTIRHAVKKFEEINAAEILENRDVLDMEENPPHFKAGLELKRYKEQMKELEVDKGEDEESVDAGDFHEELEKTKKEAEPDELAPREQEGLIHVPLVKRSDYPGWTVASNAWPYDSERGIDMVFAVSPDEVDTIVCEFIFDIEKRWTAEWAKKEAESLNREEILENLDCLKKDKDFLASLNERRLAEKARQVEVEKETLEEKIDAEDLQEELKRTKKESELDEMAPTTGDEKILVPVRKFSDFESHGFRWYPYDSERGIEVVIGTEMGDGARQDVHGFEFLIPKRWTIEWAAKAVEEFDAQEIRENPDCLKEDKDFLVLLKGKRLAEEAKKLEIEQEKQKDEKVDTHGLGEELAGAVEEKKDKRRIRVAKDLIYVAMGGVHVEGEESVTHVFDYDLRNGISCTMIEAGHSCAVNVFAFDKEQRWTEETVLVKADSIDQNEITENYTELKEIGLLERDGKKDFVSLMAAKRLKERAEKIEVDGEGQEPERTMPEFDVGDLTIGLKTETETKTQNDRVTRDEEAHCLRVRMIKDLGILNQSLRVTGCGYDPQEGIGCIVAIAKDRAEILEFYFDYTKRWTAESALLKADEIDKKEILDNLDLLDGEKKQTDFLGALERKRAAAELAKIETEPEEPSEPAEMDTEDIAGKLEQERLKITVKIEETENFIHYPVRDKKLFRDGTWRTFDVSKSQGISAVAGKLKNPPEGQTGSLVIQKYLFAKAKGWTIEKARKWIKEHKKEAAEYERHLDTYVRIPPFKFCVCPECGYSEDKEAGKPCQEIKCPECGAALKGSNEKPEEGEKATYLEEPDLERYIKDRTLLEQIGEIEAEIKGAIPYKKYPLAPEGTAWDAGKARRQADTPQKRKIISAWVQSGQEDKLTAYKYPHQWGADPYQVVWRGVAAGMARLMQNPGQPDRPGIHKHLAGHYKDFGKEIPALKEAPYGSIKEVMADVESGVLDKTTGFYLNLQVLIARGWEAFDEYVGEASAKQKSFESVRKFETAMLVLAKKVGIETDDPEEHFDLIWERTFRVIEGNTPDPLMFKIDEMERRLIEVFGEKEALRLMMEKIGAVLNRKNKKRISDAIALLESVQKDASTAEEPQEGTGKGHDEPERTEEDGIEVAEVGKVLREDAETVDLTDKGGLKRLLEVLVDSIDEKIDTKLDRARGKIDLPKK